MVLKVLLGLDDQAARELTHPNDAVYEVDVAAGRFTMHQASSRRAGGRLC
ncbi:hypothetical protein [Nesterenkonia ebinurensis]|nr:hypothetical protein [Nesterenkonia ebinurensis]